MAPFPASQMMGAVVKRYFAGLINKKAEDICLVSEGSSCAAVVPGNGPAQRSLPGCFELAVLAAACAQVLVNTTATLPLPSGQVSVMPCTAKKYEAERGELRREGEGPDIGGWTWCRS